MANYAKNVVWAT